MEIPTYGGFDQRIWRPGQHLECPHIHACCAAGIAFPVSSGNAVAVNRVSGLYVADDV